MDCSPRGSCVHGIPQAKILEWVAISFSRGASQPRDQTQVEPVLGVVGAQHDHQQIHEFVALQAGIEVGQAV